MAATKPKPPISPITVSTINRIQLPPLASSLKEGRNSSAPIRSLHNEAKYDRLQEVALPPKMSDSSDHLGVTCRQ
jgi:hypothetical protein